MTITKGAAEYAVKEYKTVWVLIRKAGKITIRYSVKKDLCPDFDVMKNYITNNDLF